MKITIITGGGTSTRDATRQEIIDLAGLGDAEAVEAKKALPKEGPAPKDEPEACDDDDDDKDAKKKGARLVETPHAKPVAAKVPEEAKAPYVPSPVPPPVTKK